jgi:hypothetical protein
MQPQESEAFRRFLQRTWQSDIAPLLRGRLAAQRRVAARTGGKAGAAAGMALDRLLGLRGKPFTRALTVFGGSTGALLPDVWDWSWLRSMASAADRAAVHEHISRQAGHLSVAEALALFDLPATATLAEVKSAWRTAALRWHPDRAHGTDEQAEYHLRFVTYQAAYERLVLAFESGGDPG